MKAGFRGINSGCRRPSKVWGVSCNAPGNHLVYGDNDWNHGWASQIDATNQIDSTGYKQSNLPDEHPYEAFYPVTRLQEVFNSGSTTTNVDKVVLPKDEEFEVVTEGRTWDFYAAQVPAIWPQTPCQGEVPMSSRADGTWSHTLGWVLEHYHYEEDGITYDVISCPRYCYGSRAIFEDGEQTYVSYCTSDWSQWYPDNPYAKKLVSRPYDLIGVHSILPTGKNEEEGEDITTYGQRCTTFNLTLPYTTAIHGDTIAQSVWPEHNTQEIHMLALGHLTHALAVGDPPWENSYGVTRNAPVNCRCYGKHFFIMSSYKPGSTILGVGDGWAVGRIEYNGTRYKPNGDVDTESTIQAYCSPAARYDDPWPTEFDNEPRGDLGVANDGQYVIALPSVRCYIDNSTISEAHPHDECWVIALDTEDEGAPTIITAQWKTISYRSGMGTVGNEHYDGAADGTLHTDDIGEGKSNVILDKTDSYITDEFPDETWEELKIWCYNRVHNYQTGHSVDLVLFTTQGAEETEVEGLIADFEPDPSDGFDPQYLDHNIDQYDLSFVRSNSSWGLNMGFIAESGTGYEGTNCALAELLANTENVSQLELTINVLYNGGYVDFYYWYDNRRSGQRQMDAEGGTYTPTELTNFPEVDHQFKILVNGETVTVEVITDPDGVPSSENGNSIIDNVTLPSGNPFNQESFYEQYRKIRIPVKAGTNTIRWIVNRKWTDDYGRLILRIDKIILPAIMIGDDINAVHRWFFDGTRVRKNPFWAWARRNEEFTEEKAVDEIYARVSTVPDFITMLTDGRIAIGNPHYVAVIVYDEETDEWSLDPDFGFAGGDGFSPFGFIRFTASPLILYEADCEDPDEDVNYVDQISDPPVGVFQILPTSDGGFQIRCANAAMRDATHYPIDIAEFTFVDPRNDEVREEKFQELLKAKSYGAWASRCHAWTISSDGKTRVPHVEVIWRPTLYQPAWPETGPYQCPPYRKDFDAALPDNPDWAGNYAEGGVLHYRDPLAVDEADRADVICWTLNNYIIPRIYCDTLSRTPQAAWMMVTDDPEGSELGVGDYWEPCWAADPKDFPPGTYPIASPRNINSPWGSARWKLTQHRFIPITRNTRILYNEPMRTESDELCRPTLSNIEGFTARINIRSDEIAGTGDFFSFPDFDAVFEIDPGCEGYSSNSDCANC